MRSSRPRAERSCWSTSSRASVRPRWCIAPGEGTSDSARTRDDGRDGASPAAQPHGLARDRRYICGPDRGFPALVDLACGDLQRADAAVHGTVPRRPRVPAIAEAADLHRADRAGAARAGGDTLVGCDLGRAILCGQSDHQAAGATRPALPFRALATRALDFHRLFGILRLVVDDVLAGGLLPGPRAQDRCARTRHLR